MNPRIAKLKDEIAKTKDKVNKGQIRLRELEKQLVDLENADIISAVRGVDIPPDELENFVKMFKAKQHGGTVPNIDVPIETPTKGVTNTKNDEEDSINED